MTNKEENKKTRQTDYSNLKIGDIIQLGVYPQGEHGEVQPIDWIVVDLQDNVATVVSKYILDCKAYNETLYNDKWKECSLRKWLNFDFYHESKLIEAPLVVTQLENNVVDPLYVLSKEEAAHYFRKIDRCTKGTPFTIKNSLIIMESGKYQGNGYYWLRTRNYYPSFHYIVGFFGVMTGGPFITSKKVGIRPVTKVLIDLL